MTTTINQIGTNGAAGTNGTSTSLTPGNGFDGSSLTYTFSGPGDLDATLAGGNAGRGGNAGTSRTGGARGGTGGNGGNASASANNLVLAPASGGISIQTVGGWGGDGGTGTNATNGEGGSGGNATSLIENDDLVTTAAVTSLLLQADADYGSGGYGTANGASGTATATISGNGISLQNTTTNAQLTVVAQTSYNYNTDPNNSANAALQTGGEFATVSNNTFSGNISSFTLDAYGYAGTGTISGNTITMAPGGGGGYIRLAPYAVHEILTNNTVTAPGQIELDLGTTFANSQVTVSGNSLNGENGELVITGPYASSNTMTVTADMTTNSLVIDGGSNTITNFSEIALTGNAEGTLTGDSGNNTLIGGQLADTLSGGSGNDTLNGGDGNNILIGGPGNDTLIGGSDHDIAVFYGPASDYTITTSGDITTVKGLDGTDTLTGIEQIEFTQNVTLGGHHTASDLNGDHISDLVFQGNGSATLWQMEGTSLVNSSMAVDPGYTIMGTGDFDDDGNSDILLEDTSTGQAMIWFMNGSVAASRLKIGAPVTSAWKIVGTGDFNNDGDSDMVWSNSSTNQISIWEMQGSTVSSRAFLNVPAGQKVVGTGDFNDDGKSDLLLQNTSTGQAVVWLMNGTTVSQKINIGSAPGSVWSVIGAADFDSDGQSDILWQNSSTGQALIWKMNGTTTVSRTAVTAPAGSGWKVIGTGDLNGDGNADILWQNSNGQAYVSFMSGATVLAGSGNVGPNLGSSWHLVAGNS